MRVVSNVQVIYLPVYILFPGTDHACKYYGMQIRVITS